MNKENKEEHKVVSDIEEAGVEKLSEKLHEIYQIEAKRQGDVRHSDDYYSLSENIKEYDRVLARFILKYAKAEVVRELKELRSNFAINCDLTVDDEGRLIAKPYEVAIKQRNELLESRIKALEEQEGR